MEPAKLVVGFNRKAGFGGLFDGFVWLLSKWRDDGMRLGSLGLHYLTSVLLCMNCRGGREGEDS